MTIPPAWIFGGILAVAVGGYVLHCEHAKGKLAEQAAIAKEQEKTNAATAMRQLKLKERTDEEYERRIADLRGRLRVKPASVLPAAPTTATDPQLACFDYSLLERALQRLDNGVRGLLEEGDEAAIGLEIAKRWAQGQ